MCLAIPGKINSVKGDCATVDFSGVERSVSVSLTPKVKPGDYVIVHAGFAIQKIGKNEAKKTLKLFNSIS